VDIQHEERAKEEKYLTISGWITAKKKDIDKKKDTDKKKDINKTNKNNSSINTHTNDSSNKNGVHGNDTGGMNINGDEGSDTAATSTESNETLHDAFEYDGGLTEPATSLLIDINDNNTSNVNHNDLKKRILLRPYEGVASRKKGVNSCEGQGQPLQPLRIETKEVDLNEIDLYLNTCGPIWDIAFSPNSETDTSTKSNPYSATYSSTTSTSTAILEKHLAIATSRIGWPQQPFLPSSGKSSMVILTHEPKIFMI
jgi:hypothetical protein